MKITRLENCEETAVSMDGASGAFRQVPIGKADGVAICVNPENPARSTVIGADPQKGIGNFDLKGNILEVINFGTGGGAGVDVRHNFPLAGEKVTLAVEESCRRSPFTSPWKRGSFPERNFARRAKCSRSPELSLTATSRPLSVRASMVSTVIRGAMIWGML